MLAHMSAEGDEGRQLKVELEHVLAADGRARLRRAFDVILQAARTEDESDSDAQGSKEASNEGS